MLAPRIGLGSFVQDNQRAKINGRCVEKHFFFSWETHIIEERGGKCGRFCGWSNGSLGLKMGLELN